MRPWSADVARSRRPRRPTNTALAALLAVCALGPGGGLVPAKADDGDAAIAPAREGDHGAGEYALGASEDGLEAGEDGLGRGRLFFTAAERGRSERVPIGRERAAGETTDAGGGASPDDAAALANGVGGGRREPGPTSGTDSARAVKARSPRGLFQARIRVGTRVRVVVDGQPCRGVAAESGKEAELRCDALPDGVRALSLDPDGRRLVATLADGGRRWLRVGEAALP